VKKRIRSTYYANPIFEEYTD
jgi:hypothetical protein